MPGSSFGYGDALRQQIDILLRTGGTEDVDQLKDSVVQLNAVMVTTATVMRDAGASAEEIAAAIRPIANDIRNVMRGVDEFSRSTQASAEAKQRAAQLIIEADEGIARAEAMAWMAGEEAARKRDAEAGRTEWLAKQIDGLSHALEAMHAHEQTAAAATRTTTGAIEGQGAAVGRTQEEIDRQNRRAAYSFLQLGRVIDDMQYMGEQGLRPIINNIMEFNPKIGIALVAFELLRKVGADELRALGREFGLLDDPVHKFISSIQDAKDRLEALTAKKHKIQVDYEQIEQATRQLDRMEKNLRAFEAHRETAAQKDMAKQAVDVIERFVGGTPELEKAIYESRKVAGVSSGSGKDEMELARLRKVQQGLSGRDDLSFEERAQAKELAKMIAEIEARVEEANKAFAKDEAGAVARGDEGAVKRMQNLARDVPGAFGKIGPGGRTGAQAIADLPSTQAEANRRAEVLRSAHEAIANAQTDDDVTPGEKAQAIADQVNRLSAIPGEAGRKAHEAAKKALAAARKAYEHYVKAAEDEAEKGVKEFDKEQKKAAAKAERRTAKDLTQDISRAMADKAQTPEGQEKAIADALGRAGGLDGDELERVKDAAINAREQLANRGIVAGGKAKVAAQKAAADDIRDSIRDIGISGQDAGAKQQALQGVAARIHQQAATLGEEAVGDLMRAARAAFQAAGRQGDAELKRELADERRAIHAGQPTAVIRRAAEPFVQQAVAAGVPHGQAQHAITGQMQNVLTMGGNLQQATLSVMQQMPAFLMHHQQQLQAQQGQLNGIQGQLNGLRAGARGNRGGGLPTLSPTVRP